MDKKGIIRLIGRNPLGMHEGEVYFPRLRGERRPAGRRMGRGIPEADVSDEIMRRGRHAIKTLFNVRVESTANIIPDASDDVSGAAFCKMGLVYCTEVAKRLDPDRSDVSYRGAVELNGWTAYVFGTYRPSAFGVEILGDATSPTS